MQHNFPNQLLNHVLSNANAIPHQFYKTYIKAMVDNGNNVKAERCGGEDILMFSKIYLFNIIPLSLARITACKYGRVVARVNAQIVIRG